MDKMLFHRLSALRHEVSSLRESCNKLMSEKEELYGKKAALFEEFAGIIGQIKELRAKRDGLTSDVKQSKKLRNDANEKIKSKILEIENLNKERKELVRKHEVKSYNSVVREITHIELKIETEVVSFEKEKKMMRHLNHLKDLKKKIGALESVEKKLKELYYEIKSLRKEADKAHYETRTKAEESQTLHKKIIELSKRLEEIGRTKKEVIHKYKEKKKQFVELRLRLKGKSELVHALNEEIAKINREEKERLQKKKEEFLHKTEQELQQKILRGEKITTSDLLSFQDFDSK